MPSWNIHTAIVEQLLDDYDARALGIADANAFLFGNFIPDVYVGFMVPDASMRIDYCITHLADINTTPIPDADRFWNFYVARRPQTTPAGISLTLGAWAHLVADRIFNGRFRTWCGGRETPSGDALRIAKQADFDVFGRSLDISSHVETTPELLDAAWTFKPYRILAEDVKRAVEVASAIVCAEKTPLPDEGAYQLLDSAWMQDVLGDCVKRLAAWLATWQQLEADSAPRTAADVRVHAGLPPATSLDTAWSK